MKLRDCRFSRKKTRCSLLATVQNWNTILLRDWFKRAKYVIMIITCWHYSISTCLNFSLSGICNMRILTFWIATTSQGFKLTTWKCRIELILLAMRRGEEKRREEQDGRVVGTCDVMWKGLLLLAWACDYLMGNRGMMHHCCYQTRLVLALRCC